MHIINLREKPEAIPRITQWHHAEWSYLNPTLDLATREKRMQLYLVKDLIPSTWLAVEDDGTVLGSAAIVDSDMDSRPELGPWLASVYVEPTQRGRGLGKQLVQHVMEQARAGDIQTLYLYTPGQAAFYDKLGWVRHEVLNHHGTEVAIMRVDFTS